METVSVKIGVCSMPTAKKNGLQNPESYTAAIADAEWLADVLDMPFEQAKFIRSRMRHDSYSRGYTVVVTMTYEKLGRYTTRRFTDNVHKYWMVPRPFHINKSE